MAWYKHTPTNLGWFWRGTQSAIFFYVSCTPCFMYEAKRKQQKENKRAMAERDEQMRQAEGMFYGQPLPFQTNEAWRSEIELGADRPIPEDVIDATQPADSRASSRSRQSAYRHEDVHRPPGSRQDANGSIRGSTRKDNGSIGKEHASERKQIRHRGIAPPEMCDGTDNSRPARKRKEDKNGHDDRDTTSTAVTRSQRSGPGSSAGGDGSLGSTVAGEGQDHGGEGGSFTSGERASGRKRRYQRPIEPLWGITDGFGPRGNLEGYQEPEPIPSWYVQRNPEVNELHPPVVSSLPKSKKEALWMLQPPPPAAFMEGRIVERQAKPRSRAATGTTRSTSRSTRLSASPQNQRTRVKSKRRRASPQDSTSSQDDVLRSKRLPKPLSTIASDEI